jgi:hypothetical protein
MRKWAAIWLLLALAGISSGSFDFLHRLQHQRATAETLAALQAQADRVAALTGQKMPARHQTPTPLPSDTSECAICLVLHSPLLIQALIVLLAFFGLLSIPRREIPGIIPTSRLVLAISCRGPPAFLD